MNLLRFGIVAGLALVARSTSHEPRVAPRAHADVPREQILETEQPRTVELRQRAHEKPPPPKAPVPPDDDPAMPHGHRPVRTPADEDLPPWCPVTGRLTVLESSDMAENLGLVPPGTTAANPDRIISVVEELEKEQARAPKPATSGSVYITGETFVDSR